MASYTAISVNPTLTTTAAGLQIKAWDRILQMRALPEDIFFAFGGTYSTATKTIPNAIYMKVPATANQSYSVTFPLLMPLSTDPGMGTGTDILGNAEQQSLRQFIAYYNDYDKSVKSTGFGIEYIEGMPYSLMEKITPLIAQYLKEMYGYWFRYCLINGISPNILANPVAQSVVPHPNTLVKGVPLADQPSTLYNPNAATMASIIASSFAQVPAGTAGAITPSNILAIAAYYTYTRVLAPLNIGGESVYIMTIPTSQKNYLLDPSVTNSLGAVWQAVSRFQNKTVADLPQVLGQIANVVLVEDPRAPVAEAFGTGSGSSTSSGTNAIYVDKYLKPGLNDQRNDFINDTNVMEACFFLGNGAVADIEPETAHYETETQQLGKNVVKGAMGCRGFNRMDFDQSTPTNTTKVNQSSGIYWVRKQTSTNL
jgi:hypothetical protein